MTMKCLLLLTFPLLAIATEFSHPEGYHEFVEEVKKDEEMDEKKRNLFFGNYFGAEEAEKEQVEGTVGLGGVCGNRNRCMDGLQCTNTGAGWKLCLPMNCIQDVVDAHNQANDASSGQPKPFEEFALNVMEGAGISESVLTDNLDIDVLNTTTFKKGKDFLMNHPFDVIKNGVRGDLMRSLAKEAAKDDIAMDLLQEKVQRCMNQYNFMPEASSNEPTENTEENPYHMDDGERRLQTPTPCLTIPGFFLEGAAGFQFVYGMGVLTGFTENSTETIYTHDFCIGGGPTVGASAGFLLQFWIIPGISVEEQMKKYDLFPAEPNQFIPSPFPALMIDVDAAAGLGFGAAYNTIGFFCHRIWLKFHLGAGGGLAFSICVVGFCGEQIFS